MKLSISYLVVQWGLTCLALKWKINAPKTHFLMWFSQTALFREKSITFLVLPLYPLYSRLKLFFCALWRKLRVIEIEARTLFKFTFILRIRKILPKSRWWISVTLHNARAWIEFCEKFQIFCLFLDLIRISLQTWLTKTW